MSEDKPANEPEAQDQPADESAAPQGGGEAPASEPATVSMPVGETAEPAEPATDDEKTMAMLAHMLGIVVGFVGPLIIWLIKREESKFVDDQGKEALNLQLTILIGWVVVFFLSVVTCGIGGILGLPLFVVVIVFCIIGGLKAKEGVLYRYPLNIRMIK